MRARICAYIIAMQGNKYKTLIVKHLQSEICENAFRILKKGGVGTKTRFGGGRGAGGTPSRTLYIYVLIFPSRTLCIDFSRTHYLHM